MINEEIKISYEKALTLVKKSTAKKMKRSIEILRKGESLAKAYDPEHGYWLGFSGGKDSQVVYHLAKMAGVLFTPFIQYTTVDMPENTRFVREQYPHILQMKTDKNIFQLTIEKKILPSRFIRTCCKYYKEDRITGVVELLGIRHEESTKRAEREAIETSDFRFKGSSFNQLDHYRENIRERTNKRIFADQKRVPNQKGEFEIGCIHGKETLKVNPIIYWKEFQVWDFLNAIGAKHSPCYDGEYHRVGCINCPLHSDVKLKLREVKRYPHVMKGWLHAIEEIYRDKKEVPSLFYKGEDFKNASLSEKRLTYLRIYAAFLIAKKFSEIKDPEISEIVNIIAQH